MSGFKQLESALNWVDSNKNDHSNGAMVLITDTIYCNAEFMLHFLCSRSLRQLAQDTPIPPTPQLRIQHAPSKTNSILLYISFADDFTQFNIIQKKLGNNLAQLNKLNQFVYIDGRQYISNSDKNLKELRQMIISEMEGRKINIPEEISTFHTDSKSQGKSVAGRLVDIKINIVIDDVSMLLFCGKNLSEIMKFVSFCRIISSATKGIFGLRIHSDSANDDTDTEQERLLNTLSYMSQYVVQIKGLDSGFTEGIHGQISVKEGVRIEDRRFSPRTYLYTLQDLGVVISAKGLAAI
ncbi:Elongator subunit elp6 [Nowakowskiella sp. JEL0407]|nr:Elongator subunit elp6 [Nowakowskiella sp. JEL0407]